MLKRLDVFKWEGKEYCFLQCFCRSTKIGDEIYTSAVKVINTNKKLESIDIPIAYTEPLSEPQQEAMKLLAESGDYVCAGDHKFRLPTWNKLVRCGLATKKLGVEEVEERQRSFFKQVESLVVTGNALDADNRGRF